MQNAPIKTNSILKKLVGIANLSRYAYTSMNGAQGGPDYVLSSQTEKMMAGTKFSDYLDLKQYKNAKKLKHFNHLRLANRPQSFAT